MRNIRSIAGLVRNERGSAVVEFAVIVPIMLTLLFGFYPAPILDVTAKSVNRLVANHTAAIKKARAADGTRVVINPAATASPAPAR